MKNILVPTDFMPCANNALNFAVQSARIINARIIVLHVFEMKENMYVDYLGVNKEFRESMLQDVLQKLKMLKESIEQTEGISIETRLVKSSFKDAFVRTLKEENIDMVIMGASGAGLLAETIWGSKTATAIGCSTVPVMVIPADYVWKRPQQFLLTTHYFEEKPGILDFLFELADLYMARVQAAIFTDQDSEIAITFLEHVQRIPRYEKLLKEKYHEDTLTMEHLYGADFSKTLEQHIKEKQIDVLVMITYQKHFWDRLFHPSMTRKMSYHTRIPLLAIPAKAGS